VSATRAIAIALVVLGLGAASVPAPASADFGIDGFSVAVENQNGTPTVQAGAHPYALHADLALHTAGGLSDGDLRDLRLQLPPGLLVNPTAVNECSAAAFATPRVSPNEVSLSGESCPNASQVGIAAVHTSAEGGSTRYFGIFNLIPAFGTPAAIGLAPYGVPIVLGSSLREADAGLDLGLDDLSEALDLQSIELTIWGAPWLAAHDGERGNCLNERTGASFGSCLVFGSASPPTELIKTFLTQPSTPCGAPLAFAANASSWQGGGATASAQAPALEKCNKSLSSAKVQLMTDNAASGSGLVFNLDVNDGGGILNPGGIARPAIKRAQASLPEGLTINPSVGAGLGTCSEAEFARESAGSEPGAGCPNPSKVGEVEVEGPLGLAESLRGSVFVARPFENPAGTMLALYIVASNARRGLIVKSIGAIVPDPRSGRLTIAFDDLPRILYTHFRLTLREGQRSMIVSPPACGTYPTDLELSSWATPDVFAHQSSALAIRHGEAGGPCPAGGAQPFAPKLLAGSLNPSPATYTPFYLRMTRTDGEQEITSYSASFPPGMLAKLAGVGDCPDAAIAAARGRSGAAELASPSCPAGSRVGRTLAGYGVGATLAYAPGGLYLAGPYRGAPLSIVAIDSALVGPYDLGTVVVRSAIRIDPRTAQASIDSTGSDPIPHILGGIPLHLRDIRVYVDRPAFTNTPTSCDPLAALSTLTGAGADLVSAADDSVATSSQRYQLLGCSALAFKPKLALALKGATKQGHYPSLRATYTARPGDANLGKATVTLPPSLFLAQEHLDTICTRVQFAAAAGNGTACPAGSVIGHASVTTPLLEAPLRGTVYLRSSSNSVPDMVVALAGRGIEIEVVGRIDSRKGGIRASFEVLPDAPVSRFTLSLLGAKRSLLVNAENLCASPRTAKVRFVGQNNDVSNQRPRLTAKCGKGTKSKPKGGER
jgi:hypothetical protein